MSAFQWPWVSRRAYTVVVTMLAAERRRTEALTETLISMKVSGAVAVRSVVPQGTKLTPRPLSRIQQAIDENKYASSNPALRSYLAGWAERELRRGTDIDEVEDRLKKWSAMGASDDEDDEDDADGVIATGTSA